MSFLPRQACCVCDRDQEVISMFSCCFLSFLTPVLPIPPPSLVLWGREWEGIWLLAGSNPWHNCHPEGKNTPSAVETCVKSSHFCRNVGLQLAGCSKNRWVSILGYDKDPSTDSSVWQGRNINPGAEGEKEAIWKDIKRCEQIPRLRLVNISFLLSKLWGSLTSYKR